MKIRVLKGMAAGLVIEHNPHVAHQLIARGLAEAVVEVKEEAAPEPEAAVIEPVAVEVAAKPAPKPRGRKGWRR